MADRVGFEPTRLLHPHEFQSCSLNRSDTCPSKAKGKRKRAKRTARSILPFTFLLLPFHADREGFEPPVPCSTMVFETTAFDHSATCQEGILQHRAHRVIAPHSDRGQVSLLYSDNSALRAHEYQSLKDRGDTYITEIEPARTSPAGSGHDAGRTPAAWPDQRRLCQQRARRRQRAGCPGRKER